MDIVPAPVLVWGGAGAMALAGHDHGIDPLDDAIAGDDLGSRSRRTTAAGSWIPAVIAYTVAAASTVPN
jgi:hypothetical protein